MKRIVFAVVSVMALALAGVAAAQTSGAHFTQGGDPVCTDIGTSLNCDAELAGLGGEDLLATLTAPGAVASDLLCQNKGGNQAPGQNPAVPTTATGSQTITQVKNGRAVVDVSTLVPAIGARAAGCPNGNWDVIVGNVSFGDYTLRITQGGELVVTCTGTFLPGLSANGETSTPTCTFA